VMAVVSLYAMEKQKDNAINNDTDLLARKKAFGLELKSRKKAEFELLLYPEGSNIKIDTKKLSEELGFRGEVVWGSMDGATFRVPAGMDEKFIHTVLVPKRVLDSTFEISL